MVLFKCTCGCFFTVKDETLKAGKYIHCPNCDNKIHAYSSVDLWQVAEMKDKNKLIDMRIIPDDAKINVSFDV